MTTTEKTKELTRDQQITNFQTALEFFLRRLYAEGTLSTHDAYKALARDLLDRGIYDDLAEAEKQVGEVMAWVVYTLYLTLDELNPRHLLFDDYPDGSIIEPAVELTRVEHKLLRAWYANDGGSMGDYQGPETRVLDSIPWEFGPGWRERYPIFPVPVGPCPEIQVDEFDAV